MATPVRIRISDSTLRKGMVDSLEGGNCAAVELDDGTISVVHRDAENTREARLELAFFIRAWQMQHPHATAEFIG